MKLRYLVYHALGMSKARRQREFVRAMRGGYIPQQNMIRPLAGSKLRIVAAGCRRVRHRGGNPVVVGHLAIIQRQAFWPR
ncbi:MAG: hypothetical protein U0694_00750 [Anaerolineae bacterium]